MKTPVQYGADDAPAAELPNGHVIFTADTSPFNGPTKLFEYNPDSNSLSEITGLPAQLANQRLGSVEGLQILYLLLIVALPHKEHCPPHLEALA